MVTHDIEFSAKYSNRCALFFDGNLVSEGNHVHFIVAITFIRLRHIECLDIFVKMPLHVRMWLHYATKRVNHFRVIISTVIIFIVIPLVIYAGVTLFGDRKYYFISIIIIILACVPLFLSFEHRKPQPREILTIAVMSAISVAGRVYLS